MMKAGESRTEYFKVTSMPGVGAVADVLPTVVIIRNGIDTAVVTTVTAGVLAGEYRYEFTPPTNWVEGDEIHARLSAIVNGFSVNLVKKVGVISTLTLDLLVKYHDNNSRFYGPDGVTEAVQALSHFMVVFDDDGTTELKRIAFQDSSGGSVTLPQATRYVKL